MHGVTTPRDLMTSSVWGKLDKRIERDLSASAMDNRDMDLVVPEMTGSPLDGDGLSLEADPVSDVPGLTVEYVI